MSHSSKQFWGLDEKPFCMLIHLSQLTSIVAPGLGLILPVIMWIAYKDKSHDIDLHGKVTVNWIISLLIYSIICGIFTIIFIGFIGLAILGLMNFLFAIIAAIKANNGELWVYPFSFKFIK